MRSAWLHVAGIALLSVAWESLFLRQGLNAVDEGWALYAAHTLLDGGVLYQDAFFVFPPGHVLPAWIGAWLFEPGLVAARAIYAAFNVALCVVLYLLGRRFMPPAAALLGCAMLAIAAPDSHGAHYLFGYRYLVFSALALLCFAERLRSGNPRWIVAAGALVGLQLVFRVTPGFAAAAGIGLGTLAAQRSLAGSLREGLRFGLGLCVVVAPVLAWLAASVGLDVVLREVLVRPVAMTDLQSLPVPSLRLPTHWNRWLIRHAFVSFQFRLFALLYLGLAVALVVEVARSLRAARPLPALRIAVVAWGGIYYLRSFGRSDEAHLDSAVPIALLLLASVVSLPVRGWLERHDLRGVAVLAAFFAVWTFLTAPDMYLSEDVRGTRPVASLRGTTRIMLAHQFTVTDPETGRTEVRTTKHRFDAFDELVEEIRSRTAEDDVVLDMSASPLLLVASDRRGPGGADVVMPGTFLDPQEEAAFLARLERRPPKLVLVYVRPWDDLHERALRVFAPQLTVWVDQRYERVRQIGDYLLLAPRSGAPSP